MAPLLANKRYLKWMQAGAWMLAGAIVLAGCSRPTAAPPAETAAVQGQIKVEQVAKHSMGAPREQIGDVSASVELNVMAKASGTIARLVKTNGAKVKKGDVIAEIDSETAALSVSAAQAALDSAEKSLAAARTSVESSRKQLQATIDSYEKQLKDAVRADSDAQDTIRVNLEASKRQLADLDSGQSVAAAEAQYESAKVSLEQAKSALDGYTITAPADGVLTGVDLTEGASVTQGSKVGTVQNTGKITIKAKLSEEYAELARNKKQLVVYYANDASATRQATVTYLADLPDSATRLYELELAADNADGFFKPGTRVQIQLTTAEEENVIAVPTLSIVRDGNDTYVFVANGGKAERRQVKLGRINGTYQEILDGLKGGESLIVSGQHTLKDGDSVTVSN